MKRSILITSGLAILLAGTVIYNYASCGRRLAAGQIALSIAIIAFIALLSVSVFFLDRIAMLQLPILDSSALKKLALACALILPLVYVNTITDFHRGDIRTFDTWRVAWDADIRHIYTASSSNYPMLGNLTTTGVISIIHRFTADEATRFRVFRNYLALYDIMILVLLFLLLSRFGIHRAEWWTLACSLTPAFWAGGAVWGQIDNAGQVLFLLMFAAMFSLLRRLRDASIDTGVVAACIAAFALPALAMLQKQLLIFGIFAVSFMYLFAVKRILRVLGRKKGLALLAVGVFSFLAILAVSDIFVDAPKPFISHLSYVWLGGGSSHGDKISGNGFNLWTLLGRNMSSSSRVPVYGFLTPAALGKSLYVFFLVLVVSGLFTMRRDSVKAIIDADVVSLSDVRVRHFAGWMLLLFCLVQLGMNICLSGTHERYLYHFYPFLFMAMLLLYDAVDIDGRRLFSFGSLVFAFTMSTIYGLFVFSVISALPSFLFFVKDNVVVSSLHIVLLVYLTRKWLTRERDGQQIPDP